MVKALKHGLKLIKNNTANNNHEEQFNKEYNSQTTK